MELDEIFENSQTDDHGEIMMDVDILLEDLARLCDLKPEGHRHLLYLHAGNLTPLQNKYGRKHR